MAIFPKGASAKLIEQCRPTKMKDGTLEHETDDATVMPEDDDDEVEPILINDSSSSSSSELTNPPKKPLPSEKVKKRYQAQVR